MTRSKAVVFSTILYLALTINCRAADVCQTVAAQADTALLNSYRGKIDFFIEISGALKKKGVDPTKFPQLLPNGNVDSLNFPAIINALIGQLNTGRQQIYQAFQQCETGSAPYQLITNISQYFLTSGMSAVLPPSVSYIDASAIMSGTPFGGQSALVPRARDDLLNELGIRGDVAKVVRDPACNENIFSGSCGVTPRPLPQAPEANYQVETVYYATDRKSINEKGILSFSATRNEVLTYGQVSVSIPRDHRIGELESPSLLKLEFREDPEKHVVLLSTSVLPRSDFLASLNTTINRSPKKSLLLFVHGFNVGFEDAARRTAQMAHDLGFKGAPVFFSWPSQEKLLSYTVDEQSIIDSAPHLEQFLRETLKQTNAEKIYLVAHSMGTRALTHALINIGRTQPEDVKRVKQVILAAPDIGAIEFAEQIAPALKQLGAPVTLYASSNDRALAASMRVHGGPRAGESGDHIITVHGIETVDASNTDTDLIGHSYYGDRRSVIADMAYLINDDMSAEKRCCLRPAPPPPDSVRYWVFLK